MKISYIIKKIVQSIYPQLFVFEGNKNKNTVALTFDDGPDPQNTKKILKILEERNIKSTFFLLGSQLTKFPDLGIMIANSGHEIANHTFNHEDISKVPFGIFHKSVSNTENIIVRLCSKRTKIMLRPPYGRINLKIILYALFYKYLLVGWTVDSRDSYIRDSSSLIEYFNTLKIRPGDIILFHEDYAHTTEALPAFLNYLTGKGYQFGTVSQLIN